MSKISDSWRTPDWLFDELNEEFNFDIDLCATAENSKCNKFGIDYLSDIYSLKDGTSVSLLKGETAFMNPPYSNPKPFIEKAWEDSKHCKIVCLVKCDPSTKWWATFWEYNEKYYLYSTPGGIIGLNYPTYLGEYNLIEKGVINGPKLGCEIRFFPKRIKFDPPQEFGGKTTGPSFSSALVIMDRRGL